MATPPSLFDRAAVLRNRRRAAASPALFLQEAVAGEVDERLAEVNRTFTSAAIVSGWPDFWSARRPSAALIADEERLAFDPGAHDLILHAMALHWANDPVGQLVQCRLALQPDGLLIATMFGGRTLSELRAALAEAESRITGGLSPRVSPMADLRDLGGLLQRAGFAMPVADSLVLNVTYPDLGALMHDLRAMGETNAQSARLRRPTRRAVMDLAGEIYRDSYAGPDGRLRATFEIVTLTGWAPSDTQPRPLRPGSATRTLAEALARAKEDPHAH